MAGAAPIPNRGGRRALDAALNLVPFIDLLSCCLAFLLITAVWTQLSRIGTHPSGAASDETVEPAARALTLAIDADGYALRSSDGFVRAIPMRGDQYDDASLAIALRDYKLAQPGDESIHIEATDAIAYQRIVRAMDVALTCQFPQISIGGSS